MTKLNWDKFSHHFGDWGRMIEPEFKAGILDETYGKAKELSKQGVKCYPSSELVFKAFRETAYRHLQTVIVGVSPFNSSRYGVPVADGLAFSASGQGDYIPTSLFRMQDEWEKEFHEGLCLPCVRTNDTYFLAKQGVLMLNLSLITEEGKRGSMLKEWEPFMKFLFSECIALSGVPIIGIGEETKKIEKWTAFYQYFTPLPDTSSPEWSSKGAFKEVQTIVKNNNGEDIKFLMTEKELSDVINTPF